MFRALLISVFLASPVAAGPGIGQEPRITEGLIAVAIAYEIGRVCPDLSGRRLRGLSYLMQLRGVARDLGYSRAEIDAFIDDRDEKARIEAAARRRFASMGGRRDDVASHCRVGRALMESGHIVGHFLAD